MRSRAIGSQRSKLPCNQWICAGDPIRVDPQMPEAEVVVVASCPEDLHDQVMDICRESGMHKAFGKAGDFIDAIKSGEWFGHWKTKVCQTVLVATMHKPKCSVVKIVCIEGGPHCDEEYQAIPDLKKAVKDDMKKQNGREEDPEDPKQVAADEAAAAKHDHIRDAADAGDLAAVRGHLRRDRRCLDQLFEGRAALHQAAQFDHTAIVAFILAEGAAVDVRDIGGSTPLHQAAVNGRVESVKLLLAAKASVDIKNNNGETPLGSARRRRETEIVNLMIGNASWLHRFCYGEFNIFQFRAKGSNISSTPTGPRLNMSLMSLLQFQHSVGIPVAQHVHPMMAFDRGAARRDLPILAELQLANSNEKDLGGHYVTPP
eukprot:s2934_g20.t1